MPLVWMNGELVEAALATIPALDRGVLSGAGLFETLHAYDGLVWAFDEHYERLVAGSEVVDVPLPPPSSLEEACREVLRANGLGEAGVRITITRGTGPVDPHADPDGPPNVLVSAWPLPDYSRLYEDGVDVVTLRQGGRPLASVKSTSYAMSVAGRVYARRMGCEDALFVDAAGNVLEATASNVLAVFGSLVVTPPLEGILPGVTRRHALEIARALGLRTEERLLSLNEVWRADELVMTSSLREIYCVRSLDGRRLGRSGVAGRLRAAFRERVRSTLLSASRG